MLSKCLNPQCTAKFRYLWEGRLFRIDFSEVKRRTNAPQQAKSGAASDGARRVPVLCTNQKGRPTEHFWLCASCAASMTIGVNDAGEIHLLELPVPQEPVAEPKPTKLVAAS